MSNIICPYCGSHATHVDKKGYSGTKGFIGTALFGVLGAFAGTIGSNKLRITCLSCGQTFKPATNTLNHQYTDWYTNPDLYVSWSIKKTIIMVVIASIVGITLGLLTK